MGRTLSTIILTAFAACACYEAALRLIDPHIEVGQDQYSTNAIRLENYVDRDEPVDTVIVGSSLTIRIPVAALPPHWQVLSQAGGSALAGLEVIDKTERKPTRVLVEINALDADFDPAAVENAVGWPRRDLRRILWLLRTANHPLNLLLGYLRPASLANDATAPAQFAKLLAQRRDTYQAGAREPLASNLRLTARIVDHLRRAGVQVAFFEMPTDPSLEQLKRAVEIRAAAAAAFPPSSFCWIDVKSGGPWPTADGIHLLDGGLHSVASALVSFAATSGSETCLALKT